MVSTWEPPVAVLEGVDLQEHDDAQGGWMAKLCHRPSTQVARLRVALMVNGLRNIVPTLRWAGHLAGQGHEEQAVRQRLQDLIPEFKPGPMR